MENITLNAYAKINLSIDVLGKLPNGYHRVETLMQQVDLYDDVTVKWLSGPEWGIELDCNRSYLPTDERNLAYVAASAMVKQFGKKLRWNITHGSPGGKIRIDIRKRIPVGAGLAGGSGNAAAVLHALNYLWELGLTVSELCKIGAPLGSDIPFCIMGQAKANLKLGERINKDPMASSCAYASGTGTHLEPVPGLDSFVVLTKPPISISTAEVYKGLDLNEIKQRPNTEELIQGLKEQNYFKIKINMVNILELFTLNRYPIVMYTKNIMLEESNAFKVMMSGSGPTVFALFLNQGKAQELYHKIHPYNRETYLTRTIM